ncbi:MAG TPA: DUF192 domain-containing protein [Candidatus Baltobacteraceae bacterium]|jgi:hypothetical protein
MFSLLAFALALQTATPAPAAPIVLRAPAAALRLEVADTEPARERGLMNRTFLAAHTGMLFVFDRDRPVEFWMKNTLVPLDMVFVGSDGVVRSVAARVPATSLSTPDARIPRRDGSGKYVIELPAGEAMLDGIRPGAIIHGITAIE